MDISGINNLIPMGIGKVEQPVNEAASPPVDNFAQSPPVIPSPAIMKNLAGMSVGTAGGAVFAKGAAEDMRDLERAEKVVNGGLNGIKEGNISIFDARGNSSRHVVYDRVNGIVYSSIGNVDNRYLIAFNKNGSIRWAYTRESLKGTPKVDDNGNVFIRTDRHIHKLDSNGNKLWSFEVPGSTKNDTPLALGKDGTVFAVAGDREKYSGKDGIYAIKDGTQLWYRQFSAVSIGEPTPVLGDKDTLYMAAGLDALKKGVEGWVWRERETKSYLVGFDPHTGEIKHKAPVKYWPSTLDNGLTEGPDGTMYALSGDSTSLKAYTPDLKLKWTYKLEDKAQMKPGMGYGIFRHGPMFDRQGNLYIASDGTSSYPEGYLIRLDSKGKEVFNVTVPGGSYDRPVLTEEGLIYIPGKKGRYLCYDTDGNARGEVTADSMAEKEVGPDADCIIEVDEKKGTILFKPDAEKILKGLKKNVLEKLLGVQEHSGKKASGEGQIIEDDDHLMIGGIRLEKGKFRHLLQ